MQRLGLAIRVSPLLFCRYLQGERLALSAQLHVERRFYHNRYHNGHSLEVPREEIVEAHGGLAVHSGGDVGVGVGGLLHGGVPAPAPAKPKARSPPTTTLTPRQAAAAPSPRSLPCLLTRPNLVQIRGKTSSCLAFRDRSLYKSALLYSPLYSPCCPTIEKYEVNESICKRLYSAKEADSLYSLYCREEEFSETQFPTSFIL